MTPKLLPDGKEERLSGLLDIAGRVLIRPEAIQAIALKTNREPWICRRTGLAHEAHIVIETYHDTHRVSCRTVEEAEALMCEISAAIQAAMQVAALKSLTVKPARAAPHAAGARGHTHNPYADPELCEGAA